MYLPRAAAFTFTFCVILLPLSARHKSKHKAPDEPAIEQIAPADRALHALNRLTFGPRPGDIQRAERIGLDRWIEQQLNPESIPENSVLEAKLAPLDTLRMSPLEMARKYPAPQFIKAMVEGRAPWPEDVETRYMVRRLALKYRDQLKDKLPATVSGQDLPRANLNTEQRAALQSDRIPEQIALLESLPPEQQYDALDAIPDAQRRRMLPAAPPDLRRKIEVLFGPLVVVNQDLFAGKLLRAIYSDRQLEEVLTDFWFNHFNVYLDKGADRYLVTSYERDAIRPHVFGRFKDLLLATAESPAMLFYLDNFQSVGPEAHGGKRRTGLNENYGRELMELHTLGVDGGYTQHDVTEVARCFTGWTIRDPRRGGGFEFRDRLHDHGEKTVLGVKIPAGGGMDDGLRVLDILARHPSTARFISKSLAIRFVSDNPPPALIDRMAATFTATGGDLREVLRQMLRSPQFWARDAYRTKLKSPFEMVVSALRATNANVDLTTGLAQQLQTLGQPLYRKQEPTGYSNKGSEWINSASLLARMNFALALTSNHVGGVRVDLPPSVSDPGQLERRLLMTDLSPEARAAIEKGAGPDAPSRPALIAALTLGSPEFQRR